MHAMVAIQLDVVQAEARRFHFQRIFFVQIAQLEQIFVAIERVVVEIDLGVQRVDLAVFGEDERIDLGERCVERVVGFHQCRSWPQPRRSRSAEECPIPNASLRAWNGGQTEARLDRLLSG